MTAQDLTGIFWRRLWIVVLILAVSMATAAAVSKRTPRAWQSRAELLLVQRAPVMTTSPQATTSAPMVESIDTQVHLLQSHKLAQTAARSVGISADQLQAATTILPPQSGDNVIALSVEADSREHAIAWANAQCSAFVQYKNQVARQNSDDVIVALIKQRNGPHGMAKLAQDAQARLVRFQLAHHIADFKASATGQLNAYQTQMGLVASLQSNYEAAKATAGAFSQHLQQAKAAIKTSTGVRDDSQALKLQATRNDLITQREDLIAKGYKPNFPGKIPALNAQIKDLNARITAAVQGTLKNNTSLQSEGALADATERAQTDEIDAGAKLAAATRQLGQLRRETADLPRVSMTAANLYQDAQQKTDKYNALESALTDAKLQREEASGNVQISQPAFAPLDPSRPSHKRDLMVGAGIGLCLSLIAVLLLEQADRSVRTAADVRRLADGPIVAVLPQMTRAQRALFQAGETPPQLIETYNSARANLSLALRSQVNGGLDGHQVILVSSAVAGEGKSITASELAQSFARAGRRVILVNADMRRPSSVPLFRQGKAPAPGLAEVLAGEAAIPEVLRETDVHNLSVLHCGTAARNPMDLISLPQMAETIRTLRAAADVVVIDTPPAAAVADALLMAPHADCVLYVVGVGMVDGECVRNTTAALEAAAPKMLAYFVNRVPTTVTAPRQYQSDYHRPASLPAAPPRDYTASRTVALEPFPEHEGLPAEASSPAPASVVEAHSGPNGASASGASASGASGNGTTANGAASRPPMRVLPEVGSHLTAIEGPYVGQRFALSPVKALSLGTLPDNDIVLARDGTISRLHSRIAPEAGGYVVYDDTSTNGTFVNDAPITRQALMVGDVVHLGASKFRYE